MSFFEDLAKTTYGKLEEIGGGIKDFFDGNETKPWQGTCETRRKYSKLADKQQVKQLVYPQKLLEEDGIGHYMMININRIVNSKFGDRKDYIQNPEVEGSDKSNGITMQQQGSNTVRRHAWKPFKRSLESIVMQMPRQLQSTYGTDWQTSELGAAGSFINTGVALSQGNLDLEGASKAAGISLAKTAVKATDFITPGNLTDAVQIQTQHISNPFVEVLFKGVNRRDFPVQLRFAPRNQEEAKLAYEIIRRLKFHMHPELKQGATASSYYGPPSTFDITFMTKRGPNAWLNRISTCALATLNVNYTPEEYAAHVDDSPVVIECDCVFVELETLTKQRFQESGASF